MEAACAVLDTKALRNACGRYATGVAVIGACGAQGRPIGLTINSFASLSLAPPLILWSLALRSPNAAQFTSGSPFGVSILRAGHGELARRFAMPAEDKFAGVAHRRCQRGVPYLDDALATLACRVERADAVGDHLLIVGQVEGFEVGEGEPLVFFGGEFVQLGR